MIEYEMTVNIRVENKDTIDNLFITIESLNTVEANINAVELLSISGISLTNERQQSVINKFEQDPWLSPLSIKPLNYTQQK